MSGRRLLLGGRLVELSAEPLKVGGQAAVYRVVGEPGIVVKLYHTAPAPDQARRLELMARMNPTGKSPTHQEQPPELAWPLELAHTPDRREFAGYSMRLFDEPAHTRLPGLFDLRMRRMYFGERASWRFLLGVGFNLAFMTARLHSQKLVIGDFSPNNVVVDRGGFVTFLDCDSIVFTDEETGEVFPCPVQTKEYAAPERQADGPATRETDDFALAVLIYQLLSAGNHPFGGVRLGSDSDPSPEGNIVSRSSYVVHPDRVRMPREIVRPGVLPPRLLDMARQAFGPGLDDPGRRPRATDWLTALDEERRSVRACPNRPNHFYGGHLSDCPWCARPKDLFGDGTPGSATRRNHVSAVPPTAVQRDSESVRSGPVASQGTWEPASAQTSTPSSPSLRGTASVLTVMLGALGAVCLLAVLVVLLAR